MGYYPGCLEWQLSMMPGDWIPFMMPGDWRAVIVLSERDGLDCEPRRWMSMEWPFGRALGLMPFKVSSSAHLRLTRCLVTRGLAVRTPWVLSWGVQWEGPGDVRVVDRACLSAHLVCRSYCSGL